MENIIFFMILAISIIALALLLRYLYIVVFYGNNDIYIGYKKGVWVIKNFGNSVKLDFFNKKNIDTGEKIKKTSEKLKELSINKDIQIFVKKIARLKEEEKAKLSQVKPDTFLTRLEKKILCDEETLGDNLLSIFKLLFASLLFLGDIYASTKLWQDLYAKEISEGALYMGISFEYIGLVIGVFIPLLFFFIFDLIIDKSKKGNMGAKMIEYMILFFVFILILAGLAVLFGSRILPEIPFNFEPIDVIMMLFFIPATLVVAYIFNDLKKGKNGITFIFAPLELAISYIVFAFAFVWQKLGEFFRTLLNSETSEILEEKIVNLERGFEMAINKKLKE